MLELKLLAASSLWESGILSLLISKLELMLMLPIPMLFAASSGSPVASVLGEGVAEGFMYTKLVSLKKQYKLRIAFTIDQYSP